MSVIRHFLKRGGLKENPGSVSENEGPKFLSGSFEENKKAIETLFEKCVDFTVRDFSIERKLKACVFFFESLTSSDHINRFVLKQLMNSFDEPIRSFQNPDKIMHHFLPVHLIKSTNDTKEILLALYSGDCLLLIRGIKEAFIINTRETKGRPVGEPLVETSTIGPQEGFVEDISLNVTLLRKRIKTARFKTESMTLGRVTKTTVRIAYIEGIIKCKLVDELKKRLSRIDTDGFIDSGHLRRFVLENKYSPFPQEIMTERPDRCVNYLLEGRIVLLLDGSPFAVVYPAVFIDIIKTPDEVYMQYYIAMFLRIIRFIALIITTLGSAFYIALTVFHPGMIPTQLLITIASSRAGVPFPAIAEAFIMEIIFELLREASVRIPKPIGPSISIVGGLVIGQSIVEAGIASQAMVIVVASTSITAFTIPGFATNNTLRILRFPFMFAASFLGLYGVISLLIVLLLHMAARRSLGIPYLAPIAPMNLRDILDTVLHGPASTQTKRPSFLETENPVHTTKDAQPPRKGRDSK